MNAPAMIKNETFCFEGLMIERIIIHRIFPRSPEKELIKPRTSSKLIRLEQAALDALQMRITKALGNKSHGIEMSITETNDESFFQITANMMHANDNEFIEASKTLAEKLNQAQFTTSAPGGLLAIIAGRVGEQAQPFIAGIKAEPQDGFRADEHEDFLGMEYIAELLLTETQRFYKIGLLTETTSHKPTANGYNADNFKSFLFDHLMTATETRPAAAYFYRVFLGMDIQKSSKKLTQDYFEYTRAYIDTSSLSDDEKLDLHEALRSELRSKDATISVFDFSKKHIPESQQKAYETFMSAKGFPQNSINKDIDYIQAKLKRRRKYIFNNDVWIITPPNKSEEYLDIEPTDEQGITVVKIKGLLQGQQ